MIDFDPGPLTVLVKPANQEVMSFSVYVKIERLISFVIKKKNSFPLLRNKFHLKILGKKL